MEKGSQHRCALLYPDREIFSDPSAVRSRTAALGIPMVAARNCTHSSSASSGARAYTGVSAICIRRGGGREFRQLGCWQGDWPGLGPGISMTLCLFRICNLRKCGYIREKKRKRGGAALTETAEVNDATPAAYTRMAIVNGSLHSGHGICASLRRVEQSTQTQWCPHGTMTCVIGSVMHTTHMSSSTSPTAVAAV